MRITNRPEPLIVRGLIVSIVSAGISLLVAFGVDLTNDQAAAIIVLVGLVGTLVAVLLGRGKVTALVDPQDENGAPLFPYDPDYAEVADVVELEPLASTPEGHGSVVGDPGV